MSPPASLTVPALRGNGLAKHPAEDLAGRALRKLGDEAILARPLEAGEPLRAEAVGVELLGRHAVIDDDARHDALPPPVVGRADDRHLPHPGRSGEHVLDLDGMDVLAARDDHVVDAPDDPEIAIL